MKNKTKIQKEVFATDSLLSSPNVLGVSYVNQQNISDAEVFNPEYSSKAELSPLKQSC